MVLIRSVFSGIDCDSLFAFPINRAVEKHMQTFNHREKKKVRALNFLCFIITCNLQNKIKYISLAKVSVSHDLSYWLCCSCLRSLTGLGGVHGMLSTLMSRLRVLRKALEAYQREGHLHDS